MSFTHDRSEIRQTECAMKFAESRSVLKCLAQQYKGNLKGKAPSVDYSYNRRITGGVFTSKTDHTQMSMFREISNLTEN